MLVPAYGSNAWELRGGGAKSPLIFLIDWKMYFFEVRYIEHILNLISSWEMS